MIQIPTVLILGAGASMDLGYPSGRDLKDEIVKVLRSNNHNTIRALWSLGFNDYVIRGFHEELQRSGRQSVDAFLERRPEFIKIGKASIAATLMRYENLDDLTLTRRTWYEYLFQALNTSFEELKSNKLSIVTFNYDRSLDVFLFQAIKSAYGKETDEVVEILKSIPIIHVYGKLGQLPWETKGREYKATTDSLWIERASDKIRIITDDHDPEKEFFDVRKIINNSNRLIFIGFGYHSTNIKRLGIELDKGHLDIYGSAFSFTELEKTHIETNFQPSVIKLGNSKWQSLQFLREMIIL